MKKSILIAAAVMLAGISHGQMFAQMFGGSTWTPASLSPVAWYRLDGNALDSSTYANHGTLVNSPTNAVDRNGTLGGALGFGATRRITIPDAAQLNINSGITIACWAFSQSGTEGWVFCRNADSGATVQYGSYIGDSVQFFLNGANRVNSAVIPLNQWLHVVTVRGVDGAAITYTNGVAAVSATTYTNALVNAPNNNIGARSSATNNSTATIHFVGALDDVLIFNRALTQSEITQLYNWRP